VIEEVVRLRLLSSVMDLELIIWRHKLRRVATWPSTIELEVLSRSLTVNGTKEVEQTSVYQQHGFRINHVYLSQRSNWEPVLTLTKAIVLLASRHIERSQTLRPM